MKKFLVKRKRTVRTYIKSMKRIMSKLTKKLKYKIYSFKKSRTYVYWETKRDHLKKFGTYKYWETKRDHLKKFGTYKYWEKKFKFVFNISNIFKFILKIFSLPWWLLLWTAFLKAMLTYRLVYICKVIIRFILSLPIYFTRTVDTIISLYNLFWRLIVYFWIIKWFLFIPPITIFSFFAGILSQILIYVIIYILAGDNKDIVDIYVIMVATMFIIRM